MSTFDSDDLEATGYFLPEDSQLRLKKLREYVEFLANLARPRRSDEDRECVPEIRVGEVAICLELLEEQIGLVLDELSWPAERGERGAASEAETEAEADEDALVMEAAEASIAEPVRADAGSHWIFGVTLTQYDEISRLLDSLRAHANVVTCADHADLSDLTLTIIGDDITRDTEKLRDIIGDINDQRLQPAGRRRNGVREEPAAYLALPACLPIGGGLRVARQLPTYQ